MKFNFRKIASVLTSAVMLSSTVGLAAAANYPEPFVKGGNADSAVVVGSANPAASDFLAATDITVQLQEKLAAQTAVGGTAGGPSTSGGDSVNLATGSQKLYINSTLVAARTVVTANEMPNLLADGTATDAAGTAYKYTQKITPGNVNVTFSKSGESIDPAVLIDAGSAPGTGPLVNYTLTLVKAFNASDSTNVVGTVMLKIMGKDFVVGANSDFDSLYLYGSGSPANVQEGETKTVSVGGKDHTVSLRGTTSTTAGTILVDGVSKSVTKGNSYKFPGDFEVYIKDFFHATKTGTLSTTDLLLGAQTLHFESGQAARAGADDTTIQGTRVNITGSSGTNIAGFDIAQSYADSNGDYVKVGSAFDDRVMGGVFKIQFADFTPALDSLTRDVIKVDTDNSVVAKATFTSSLAQSKGPFTFNFARDNDGSADGTLSGVTLADSSANNISTQEGTNLSLNQYQIVNAGDNGRILKLTAIGPGSSTSDKTTFQDSISGESFDFTTGVANATSRTIDGNTYYVGVQNVTGSAKDRVALLWGAGASSSSGAPATVSFGDQRSLFPRIKLKNGQWIAFLTNTNVTNTTNYLVPGKYALSDYEASVAFVNTNSSTSTVTGTQGRAGAFNNLTNIGKVSYNVSWDNSSRTGILSEIALSAGAVAGCNFNVTLGPAVLVMEEKTATGSATTDGEAYCVPLTTEGTTTVTPAIGTPIFSEGSTTTPSRSLASKTTKTQWLTVFGSLVERDTADANSVTVWYPNEQAIANILVTSPTTVVTGAGATGGTVKSLGSVTVTDAEVSTVSSKNLIVVGGNCVNTAAGKLLGLDNAKGFPTCAKDFETKSGVGAGQYLIQTFTSPYSDKAVATLVAGYGAEDTKNAAKYLTTQAVDTTVGKKYKGTTATSASIVTEATTTAAANATA